MMTEEQRGKEFPIHVDMGDDGPVIELGSRAAALNLPESGCALVDFVRNKDGSLTVKTLCLQDPAVEDSDDESEDLDQALTRAVKRPKPKMAEEDEEEED